MLWKDTTFEPVDKYYTTHQKLHSFTTNCENKQQFNYHKFKSKHWSVGRVGILFLIARSGKLRCSTCLAGGPSDVGFSQRTRDSYVLSQTCHSAIERMSDHHVSSHLCGTTRLALMTRVYGW